MADSKDKNLVKVLTEAYQIGHKVHVRLLSKAQADEAENKKE